MLIWGQFIFSSWWLTVLIATVHPFKKVKNLKLIIIGCWAITTGWKLKKGMKLVPSLQNQNKNGEEEKGRLVVTTHLLLSYTSG